MLIKKGEWRCFNFKTVILKKRYVDNDDANGKGKAEKIVLSLDWAWNTWRLMCGIINRFWLKNGSKGPSEFIKEKAECHRLKKKYQFDIKYGNRTVECTMAVKRT